MDLICQLHFVTYMTDVGAITSGQPRRHLLQSGWSVFVSSKRLVAGDAFIFLRYAVFLSYECLQQHLGHDLVLNCLHGP